MRKMTGWLYDSNVIRLVLILWIPDLISAESLDIPWCKVLLHESQGNIGSNTTQLHHNPTDGDNIKQLPGIIIF